MASYLRREPSNEMDLRQPLTVVENVIAFHAEQRQPREMCIRFKSDSTLYNWHTGLDSFMGAVVRTYDLMRRECLIIKRETSPHILVPGEDGPVHDMVDVRRSVHRTLDWLTAEHQTYEAHQFFEKVAEKLPHSNRALAQHTLLMCFGLMPTPEYKRE